ncbi:hypothetical protein B6254_0061 [Weissella cibaria]|uniref:Uncharacterized protein n=1 Tax=Weissella cibaria TaxID=137591 RepID=A0A2S1KNC8_9LACO|nr:hypothetical protein B6254_0061 [Weissella cibaria]
MFTATGLVGIVIVKILDGVLPKVIATIIVTLSFLFENIYR